MATAKKPVEEPVKEADTPELDAKKLAEENSNRLDSFGDFMARKAHGEYYTSPKLRYPYYAQTTVPERQKAAGTALGISVGGAALQRGIQASAMFDPALDYARRQLAEAEATQKRPLKGMSPEKADAIRAAARAGVQTEIAETKSDLGSLMASSQQAPSVQDILAVRETGQDAQVSAAIEAEAIIAKSDLATMEAQQRQADQAKLRADEMQGLLHEKRMKQLKYTQAAVGDIVKATIEYTAKSPAASETPVVDQLMDKGMSMDDIGELHQAARAKGFYPGSQAYRNYMMSHYEGATGKDPDEPKADRAPDVAGAPVTPGRSVYGASAATRQQQAMADVRAQEAKLPPAAVQSAEDAATRLRGGKPSLVEGLAPVEGFRPPVPAPEVTPAPATPPPAGAETPPVAPLQPAADDKVGLYTRLLQNRDGFKTPQEIQTRLNRRPMAIGNELNLTKVEGLFRAGGLDRADYAVVQLTRTVSGEPVNEFFVMRKDQISGSDMVPVENLPVSSSGLFVHPPGAAPPPAAATAAPTPAAPPPATPPPVKIQNLGQQLANTLTMQREVLRGSSQEK